MVKWATKDLDNHIKVRIQNNFNASTIMNDSELGVGTA